MKKEDRIPKEHIKYYMDIAKSLSRPYDEQYGELYMLGDYLTEDLASDWMMEGLKGLYEFYNEQLVNANVLVLYKK